MDILIEPSALSGSVEAISSKSDAHRLLICAAFADRTSSIALSRRGEDIKATIDCLRTIGAKIECNNNICFVEPVKDPAVRPRLNCDESGATLRFLLPLVSAVCGGGVFGGRGRLPERPLGELVAAMSRHKVEFSSSTLPFEIKGRLHSGDYSLAGNVSSQYISALLMALPLVEGNSRIILTSELKSASYVQMTLETLGKFGISAKQHDNVFELEGGQRLCSPGELRAEGDWSNAAFFLVSGALAGPVTITGLNARTVQGDAEIVDILQSFGACTELTEESVGVSADKLTGQSVDVSNIPDLLPALAALAAFSEGETRFTNAKRLRLKESDRLFTSAAMLRGLGTDAVELEDGLAVRGGMPRGGEVDSFGDHRIAMAGAVAAAYCREATVIRNAEAVNKSYPGFFEDFRRLGGRCREI